LAGVAVVIALVVVSGTINADRAEDWNRGVRELHLLATAVAASVLVLFGAMAVRGRTVGRRLLTFLVADVAAAAVIASLTGDPTGPGGYAALGFAVLAAGIAMFWWLPKWQAERWSPALAEKDRLELEDKARHTVAHLLGGLGLLATVALTLYQVNQGRVAADRTLELNVDQQVSERFSRAVDQLGARAGPRPMVEVRLGGIYSLRQYAERVSAAAESPADAYDAIDTVLSILSAYVRTNAPRSARHDDATRPLPSGCGGDGYRSVRTLRPDIAAALQELERLWGPTGSATPGYRGPWPRVDLSNVDLRGADVSWGLSADVSLATSDLADIDLRGTHIPDADLWGSNLAGAWLIDATLSGADLHRTNLTGADLRGANLENARLDQADASNACFEGAELARATFRHADVSGAVICPDVVDPKERRWLDGARLRC
jgi:hypothetical protein